MRPGKWRGAPLLAAVVLAAAVLAACGSGITAGGLGPAQQDVATPLASPTTAMAATLAALEGALLVGGYGLGPAERLFRPSEPASFLNLPRTVYRVPLADADDGVVVIYEFTDAAGAAAGAGTLAGYLASGVGQTNFAGDTVFSVAYLGPTVALSWFSADRSGDPVAGRGAFDLIATVGTTVRVVK
jgi:hypothetical protein